MRPESPCHRFAAKTPNTQRRALQLQCRRCRQDRVQRRTQLNAPRTPGAPLDRRRDVTQSLDHSMYAAQRCYGSLVGAPACADGAGKLMRLRACCVEAAATLAWLPSNLMRPKSLCHRVAATRSHTQRRTLQLAAPPLPPRSRAAPRAAECTAHAWRAAEMMARYAAVLGPLHTCCAEQLQLRRPGRCTCTRRWR